MPRWPTEQTAECRRAVRQFFIATTMSIEGAEFTSAEISRVTGFPVVKVDWVLTSMQTHGELHYRYENRKRGGRRVLWCLPRKVTHLTKQSPKHGECR